MDISQLIKYNNDLKKEIEIMGEKIREYNKNIITNEKKIFNICKHSWDVDTCDFDRTSEVCNKCGLYKNYYMYM